MKLSQLAIKPQLIKITIDDEVTVKQFGEALEFWCYDRQPISEFMKFATISEANTSQLFEVCSELILDEDGNKIMVDGKVLPTTVLIKCTNKVVEVLGK